MEKNATGAGTSCAWDELCFCGGARRCQLSSASWRQQSPPLQLRAAPDPHPGPAPSPAASEKVLVWVTFGLRFVTTVPTLWELSPSYDWGYLPDFRMEEIWVQRNIRLFCASLPEELRVMQQWCWMSDFQRWLDQRGIRFPLRTNEFHPLALEFVGVSELAMDSTRYVWVEDGKVRAVYHTFEVDIARDVNIGEAGEHKTRWDGYVDAFNRDHGEGLPVAVHVSELWMEAETRSELFRTTKFTLLILAVLGFLGTLCFTRSVYLSCFVLVATAEVVGGFAFFIFIVLRSSVGLLEVLAVIFFMGNALTYSLHVAHLYSSKWSQLRRASASMVPVGRQASIRIRRTRYALVSIGGAALGAAITTAGASVFLMFCTVTIFSRLGLLCLVLTIVSIVVALGPLPSALFVLGPLRPGQGWFVDRGKQLASWSWGHCLHATWLGRS